MKMIYSDYWQIHHRKSIRLKNHDYRHGTYFVTICTAVREPIFGSIYDQRMFLNPWGCVAHDCWKSIPNHFPFVILDAFVVMPNHVHGLLTIDDARRRGVRSNAPTPMRNGRIRNFEDGLPPQSLATIINGYKSTVTRQIRKIDESVNGSLWQRNYHDSILYTPDEIEIVRQYILNNPKNWETGTKQKDHRSGL